MEFTEEEKKRWSPDFLKWFEEPKPAPVIAVAPIQKPTVLPTPADNDVAYDVVLRIDELEKNFTKLNEVVLQIRDALRKRN